MASQPLADGDKVSVILSVVAAAQAAQEQSREPLPIRELRLGAIDAVATRELTRNGRFKNLRSARNAIGGASACARCEGSMLFSPTGFVTAHSSWRRPYFRSAEPMTSARA